MDVIEVYKQSTIKLAKSLSIFSNTNLKNDIILR